MSFRSVLDDDRWIEGGPSTSWKIALTTFGILALELALIRWTSAQVRIFAYFSNVVLICAFLGMGLGLALGRRRPGLIHLTMPLALVLSLPLAFSEALGIVVMRFPDQSIMLWGAQTEASLPLFVRNLGVFLLLLALVVSIFIGAGAGLGALFHRMAALKSYQADLVGSLLGVLAFTACSALGLGPAWWLALGCLPFVILTRRLLALGLAMGIVVLGQLSVRGALYSPYNRIDIVSSALSLEIQVNRDFHQYMFDLTDERIARPGISALDQSHLRQVRDLYNLPFVLNSQRGTALVVGAGTGNDVQAALRQGYGHVTSVDIDGRIIGLGRELHPEAPYARANVETVVDDARAFFERDRDRKFDVVCFGLLDSHSMSSAMSTLRLDNFVYTEEGIRSAWERVAPGGHLSLAISCLAGPWFFERLYWTVARATGHEPLAFITPLYGSVVTFVVPRGDNPALIQAAAGRPQIHPTRPMDETRTTSDDWPFLYLRPGTIPWGYIVVLGSIALGAIWSVRRAFGFTARQAEWHWPLFLMGAAFLLIETRGVTSLSLLFGSTWVVNSVVFAGILLMVILANAAVARWQWQDPRPWFAALAVSVVVIAFFPLSSIQGWPLLGRAIAAGLLTGLPIGIAGVIVPMFLRRAGDPAAALGANLLGSVLGGCCEYYSMLGGLRSTSLLALALYLAAYLAATKRRTVGV